MTERVVKLNLKPCVAVFGSARVTEDHPHYIAACDLGRRLSDGYISVATGGGPGIMEAANRGAFDGNGTSVGFRINLPFEVTSEPERYHHITIRQDLFHYRQTALIENADAYAAFCGGAGTEFEIYNVITLMQCGFLNKSEIQLYGTDAWCTFDARMKQLAETEMISPEDLSLYHITDDLDEMYHNLKKQSRGGDKNKQFI